MRRGWVVALVATLVAGAAFAVGPESTAGASVNVSGTVHWTGGTLPDGAVVVRACSGFFLCSSGSVAPDAPVLGGSYSLTGLPDTGGVILWPLSTGKTASGGDFQVGSPAVISDLASVAIPVDLSVSAAIVRGHVDHSGSTPYAAGAAGVFACPASGDISVCGSGRFGLTDAAGDVVFAVAPGFTYQVAPFAGSNALTGLFGPADVPVPLGDGATYGPMAYTIASATITASVGVPAGVVADTLVFACPSPELPTHNVNGAPACSSGSTPRSSGFGASPRTLVVPTNTAFNVAAAGMPQGTPSFGSLPPLTAHTPVGALADGGAASPSFGLGAIAGTISLPGGPPPSGSTTVDFCGTALAVGDSCGSPVWRTVPDASGNYLALLPEGSYEVAPMMGTAVSPSLTVGAVVSPPTLTGGNDFTVASNAFGIVTVTSTTTGGGFVAQVRVCRSPETPAAPGSCPTLRTGLTTNSSPRTDVLYLGRATWNVATLASFSGGLFNVAPNPADSITIIGNENLTRSYSVDPPATGVATGAYSVANAIGGSVVVQLCPVGNTPGPSCPGAQNVFMTGVSGNYSRAVPTGSYQVLAGHYVGSVGVVPTQTSPTAIVNVVGNASITCNFTFDAGLVAPATNSCVGGATNPDGVSDAVEQGVPGGDGNFDGIPDWQQANVTSLPSDGGSGPYVTIASTTPGTTLEAVATADGSGSPEPLPYGVVGFTVKGVAPGATVHVDVYVPGTLVPTGYWKYSDTNGDLAPDTWVDFSTHAVITGPLGGGGYKISLELIDRTASLPGQGDDDATPGVIRDPGGPTDATSPTYVFGGFAAPIDNLPTVNTAKAGQTIPVKWRLTDANGVGISDPATFVSLTSTGGASCSTGSADAIEQYTGNTGLQYLGNGNWQFNWKTPKSYAGQCRRMKLTLADGEHVADFQFTG